MLEMSAHQRHTSRKRQIAPTQATNGKPPTSDVMQGLARCFAVEDFKEGVQERIMHVFFRVAPRGPSQRCEPLKMSRFSITMTPKKISNK